MKDISIVIEDYKFNFRVAALLENKGRYLMEKSQVTDFLNLPGGRVHAGESTLEAMKRELEEELGVKNLDLKLLKIAEQFFSFNDKNYHELDFVYYASLDENNELANKDIIKSLDNDAEEMVWIKKDELKNYKILPEFLYEIANEDKISHLIFKK